jgi:hypothetical protein
MYVCMYVHIFLTFQCHSFSGNSTCFVDPVTRIRSCYLDKGFANYQVTCSQVPSQPWDRCYDFKNIFAKKIGEKIAFVTQT